MKIKTKLILLISSLLTITVVTGQPPTPELNMNGQAMAGRPADDENDKWVFVTAAGKQYLLVSQGHYNQLTEVTAKLDVKLEICQDSIRELQNLISKYETFDSIARTNIAMQQQLISQSDSLYTGYKDLYQDLKEYMELKKLFFIPGIGVIRPPGGAGRIIGSIGVDYNNWNGHLQFGGGHIGLIMGYRLGLF